ncbi:MAG: hypothetical protein II153_02115 [Erysipelotrichaceae bacterium]|nr:hypothetical protein [Erysipelotrichaceae bacterium]
MEKKRRCLILLLLLCGCSRQRSAACSSYDGNDSLNLYLKGENDLLQTIEVEEVFVLPKTVLADETFYKDLVSQFDRCSYLEDDKLIRRYGLVIDDMYSFSRTIEALKAGRFTCEE